MSETSEAADEIIRLREQLAEANARADLMFAALPDMAACERAVTDQFAALQPHYPAMEARCVETAVLWESPDRKSVV